MPFPNKTNLNNSKLKSIFKESFVSDKINEFELKSVYQQRHTRNHINLPQTIVKPKKHLKRKMQKFNGNLNLNSEETNERSMILSCNSYFDGCVDDQSLSINHIALRAPSQSIAPKLFVTSATGTRPIIIIKKLLNTLLQLPFITSVNGFGCTTLASVVFSPRFITQNLLYPVFRLTFGTLYPAYASYKAVRNKDVKDYVSMTTMSVFKVMEIQYLY